MKTKTVTNIGQTWPSRSYTVLKVSSLCYWYSIVYVDIFTYKGIFCRRQNWSFVSIQNYPALHCLISFHPTQSYSSFYINVFTAHRAGIGVEDILPEEEAMQNLVKLWRICIKASPPLPPLLHGCGSGSGFDKGSIQIRIRSEYLDPKTP